MTKKGRCKHFNGVQHDSCKAGVNYENIPRIQTGGLNIPCLRAEGASYCPKWEEPTDEEVAKHDEEVKSAVARMTACVPWIGTMKKKYPNGVGITEGECPICGKAIRFHISSYNGHMHAKCSTADCISFME